MQHDQTSGSLIPIALRRTLESWFGVSGKEWCVLAPRFLGDLLKRWNLSPVEIYDGASHSLIVQCRSASGGLAVLKLPFQTMENALEGRALELYNGKRAVQLFECDEATGGFPNTNYSS
jgi:hypothetical protein